MRGGSFRRLSLCSDRRKSEAFAKAFSCLVLERPGEARPEEVSVLSVERKVQIEMPNSIREVPDVFVKAKTRGA